MGQENQIVSPNFTPVATPSQDRQRTLPTGPTGVVHRGGKSALSDNTQFWKTVNAVEFSSRGSSRRDVYRSVAWYVSLTDERVCFASVGTIAERAGLKATATRSQLRALERGGYIEVEGGRGGGRSGTRYRLTDKRLSTFEANAQRCPPQRSALPTPTLSVADQVIEEVIEEVQDIRTVGKPTDTPPKAAEEGRSKLRSSPHSAQQRMVCAIAEKLALPDLLTAAGLEEFDELDNAKKQILIKRLLKAEARHDSRASQTRPGRLQREWRSDPPARPDPQPLTPEIEAMLEADAIENGYRKMGGKWTKVR